MSIFKEIEKGDNMENKSKEELQWDSDVSRLEKLFDKIAVDCEYTYSYDSGILQSSYVLFKIWIDELRLLNDAKENDPDFWS